MLNIFVQGRLRRQGLTELFFESAEPTFDELSTKRFFRRFPEGEYEIEGTTLDGEELESEVFLSHVMPAPPVVYLNDDFAAESCEADLPEVIVGEPVIISWDLVTESHPGLGKFGDIEVHNYEVVVEIDETPWKTSIILPPNATSFQIPPEILDLPAVYGSAGKAGLPVPGLRGSGLQMEWPMPRLRRMEHAAGERSATAPAQDPRRATARRR